MSAPILPPIEVLERIGCGDVTKDAFMEVPATGRMTMPYSYPINSDFTSAPILMAGFTIFMANVTLTPGAAIADAFIVPLDPFSLLPLDNTGNLQLALPSLLPPRTLWSFGFGTGGSDVVAYGLSFIAFKIHIVDTAAQAGSGVMSWWFSAPMSRPGLGVE